MATLKDGQAFSLLNSLKNQHPAIRRHAAKSLGNQDLEPSLAIRHFSKSLADADEVVRVTAVKGLEKVGPAAVASLATALGHPDHHVRREAAWALGRLGSDAQDAISALIKVLNDPDVRVCQGAARALGMIGRAAVPAIPALMAVLNHSNFLLCRLASWSLGQIGPEAVPALIEALGAPELYVRCEAAWALAQMGREARQAVPALIMVLRSGMAGCLLKANEAMKPDADLAMTVPLFHSPRNGTAEAFCLLAIKALGEIGPDARDVVPDLLHFLEAGHGTAQIVAAHALKRIDPEGSAHLRVSGLEIGKIEDAPQWDLHATRKLAGSMAG
jgi:HEAT repeat protein